VISSLASDTFIMNGFEELVLKVKFNSSPIHPEVDISFVGIMPRGPDVYHT
jgi:hypothetical protein